jgi:hypothetical protein
MMPLTVTAYKKTLTVPEYCRKLIIEEKIPLKTVFEALERGTTVARIVSQYLPAGVGRNKLVELFGYFAEKKVSSVHYPR